MNESEDQANSPANDDAVAENTASTPAANVETPEVPARRRWLKRLVFLIYVLVLMEIGCRGFFAVARQVSFFNPNMPLIFYREMHPLFALDQPVSREDETVDVLLLGGSVLNESSGDVAVVLQEKLAAATGRPVVVHNVAMPGHTSLDSNNKYQELGDHRFDLVVFYHGINETRMNNCPPDNWRDDYSHSGWHARVAAIDRHPEVPMLMTPYALHYLWIKICDKLEIGGFMPRSRHLINPEWLKYGEDIRSDKVLRRELDEVMQTAKTRSDPLLVMTFATYLPDGYDSSVSSESQAEGVNDYASGGTSILDMWGHGFNVKAALQRHNQEVRGLSQDHAHVRLFEMAEHMPLDGQYFDDVCHLSRAGCRKFVDLMLPHLEQMLPAR